MASDESDEGRTSVSLPADLGDWLDEEATSRNVDRDQLLEGLILAFRQVSQEENGAIDLTVERDSLDEVPSVVEDRLDEQQTEFMDLINDVRRRVIQVKRETDKKASADHEHERLEGDLETVADAYEDLDEDLRSLRGDVEKVGEDLEAGFENYEEILEHLADETDRLDQRLEMVARVLVEIRSEVQQHSKRATRQAEVDELKLAANQHGIRSAVCENCGESIEISLLTGPECPHCKSTFRKVTPKQRFFGSHVLETGSRPALEGQVSPGDDGDAPEEALEELAEEEADSAGSGAASDGLDALGENDVDPETWANAVGKNTGQQGDSS